MVSVESHMEWKRNGPLGWKELLGKPIDGLMWMLALTGLHGEMVFMCIP